MNRGGGRTRSKHAYQASDDDDDSAESNSEATSDDDTDDGRSEIENALVQSALARIRKAQAKGKQDVRLNKEELAALERRRKRLQAEADAARRKGKDHRRQKEDDKRIAVPLSHFDQTPSPDNNALPRQALPPTTASQQPRSHSPASSHLSSAQRLGSSSPFDYQYVSPSSNQRQPSDTPRSSPLVKNLPPHGESRRPQPSHLSHNASDPFQYQTEGLHGKYPTSAGTHGNLTYNVAPAAKSSLGETTRADRGRDEYESGGRIGRNASRDNVVEAGSSPEPEHGRSKSKRATSPTSSSSHKKALSTSGSRRRKAK